MTPFSLRLRHRIALAALVAVGAVAPVPAGAQAAAAPDSFSIDTAATGMLIEVSAPAALPLDVLAGLAYAQVGVNSQPRIQSTASPLFVPLLQDVGLLGGTSGVLGIGVRLVPGLVVGLPTLIGLDPLPIDAGLVPVDPLADLATSLPVPSAPPLGCTSNLPAEPREAECGGGAQDFFGFRVGAASARTVADGDTEDPSSLSSRSDASVAGVAPSGGQPLAAVSAAAMGATAEGGIIDGRATTTASASVGDLDLAGQFKVGAVKARYAGATAGSAETFEEALDCDVVGAELAGQRIALGTESLTIPGQEIDVPLADALTGLVGGLAELGGQLGPADIGTVTITPNPAPIVEVSEDGTAVERRFGCLEIRYRILTSGTDVRLTLGNITVSLNAANDQAFSPEGDPGADVAGGGAMVDIGGTGGGVDLGGSSIDVPTVADTGGGEFALPEVPEAGGEAPPLSDRPFASAVQAAGWGIDGGWLAPFALLALAIPLLTKARTFAPTRPLRR
ncbi:MAG: hypothetical protein ACLGIZ_17930 [Acidimicrobiia bacterium]